MRKLRFYLACLWGAIAFFALYRGIGHGSVVAWWLLAALVPALFVFIWWMVDRAALERRIRRLEVRSEIGDERRVDAHADLIKVVHRVQEIETRVAQVEDHDAGTTRSGVNRREQFSGHSRGSVAAGISLNAK